MSDSPSTSMTVLLQAADAGDVAARDQLWATIYDELRLLAHAQLAGDADGALQTTVLVGEAYMRLVGETPMGWANRRHFFAAASEAMRRIRVDDARRRKRLKRGGGLPPLPFDEELLLPGAPETDSLDLLALDEALERLKEAAPRAAEVVLLRYFAGLTTLETAAALEIAPRLVDLDWRFARVWLYRELTRA